MSSHQRWAALLVVLAVTGGTTMAGSNRPVRRGAPEAPRRLADTGLYSDAARLVVDPRHRPYAPQYPLWSDGAVKTRWLSLPPGTTINATNVDAWVFPVGTKFWKEFVVAGRRVETRLLWRASTAGWVYATYKWNADQTEAVLADAAGDTVDVGPGERPHTIPSMADCRACHESRRTEVLGFTALELSTDRDPNAIHGEPLRSGMTTLDTLVRERLLTPVRPELVTTPPRIAAATPRERAVLGYLSINCGICHNADGPLAEIGMHLKQPAYSTAEINAALRTTVGVPASWQIPGGPMPSHRVTPGATDLSALMVRMRSRRPASQMPPLGTALPDREAIAAVADWIQQLGD